MDNWYLWFVIGLIVGTHIGFWCREVWKKLNQIRADIAEKRLYEESGIVKPIVTPVNRGQVPRVDLTTSSGGVRRPTPDEVLIANQKRRDEHLKSL